MFLHWRENAVVLSLGRAEPKSSASLKVSILWLWLMAVLFQISESINVRFDAHRSQILLLSLSRVQVRYL